MTLRCVNADKEASNVVFWDNAQSTCCFAVHRLCLMLFDLCKDFSLFYQDQGIRHLAPMSLLRLGPETALAAGCCPPASHFSASKTLSCCCGTGKHGPWKSSKTVTMWSSCLLWKSILKQGLCKTLWGLSSSDVSQAVRKVTQWQKVTEVFYQPSKCLSRTPLPGLAVAMNMSSPASCTFVVVTDKFRSWRLGLVCSSCILVGAQLHISSCKTIWLLPSFYLNLSVHIRRIFL